MKLKKMYDFIDENHLKVPIIALTLSTIMLLKSYNNVITAYNEAINADYTLAAFLIIFILVGIPIALIYLIYYVWKES